MSNLTYSCNFENTDLSNNLITGRPTGDIYLIDKTNLSNTGIKINFTGKIGFYSNFSDLDLSTYEVNARDFFNSFEGCYFTNTELKIKTIDDEMYDVIEESLEEGFLDGCYIDGEYTLDYEPTRKRRI